MSETNERSVASAGSVASDIVARLRRTVAGSRRWHRNPDGPDAADEIERLRLTDAERSDLTIAADAYADNDDDPDCERIAATLRGLLERLG